VDNKQEKNSFGKNDRLGTAVYKGAAHEGFTPRSTLICGQKAEIERGPEEASDTSSQITIATT
jgi:hypothetical protein